MVNNMDRANQSPQGMKCFFCGQKTQIRKDCVKKKIHDKVVTITNAPVYLCLKCNETFISKEAQDAINYIRDNSLETKKILFSYDELCKNQ